MRLVIAAVSRIRPGPERDIYEYYAGRLTWKLSVVEIDSRRVNSDQRRSYEGDRLLAAIPDGAMVVALDETGQDINSAAFATRLADWRDRGIATVAFLIGGAEGLDNRVLDRADLVVAFGRQTWPHLLVRGMLAEQLYRAQQIIAGHPYHRA